MVVRICSRNLKPTVIAMAQSMKKQYSHVNFLEKRINYYPLYSISTFTFLYAIIPRFVKVIIKTYDMVETTISSCFNIFLFMVILVPNPEWFIS
jgi:hypothetical protein